ncbi:zinc ABC transporter substrate-binding protein [Rhizobiaceae bacterium]|nr:zinc ABC transporter substrate-binding protein [Rhizobiaceae bacterium]
MILRTIVLAAATLWASGAQAAPNVVATLPPVHSIVAAVMAGAGEPVLLNDGRGDPHHGSLKPSQLRALAAAELVVRVGAAMEESLEDAINALPESVPVVAMQSLPLYDASERELLDPHRWLDPAQAAALATAVAETLAKMDAENDALYRANAQKFALSATAVQSEIEERLTPFEGRPFITMHDGLAHLERASGLERVDTADAGHGVALGAARMQRLRTLLASQPDVCVLADVGTSVRAISALTADTSARIVEIDPLGVKFGNGPDQWRTTMDALIAAIAGCFA